MRTKARPVPFAPLALRLLVVLLTGVVLFRMSGLEQGDLRPGAAQTRSPLAPVAASAPEATPPEAAATNYPAITQRPLFFASRKPWRPPQAAKPPPVARPPVKLVGYVALGIVESGSIHLALVKAKTSKTVMLYEGQKLDGWTLKTITGNQLHFVSGSLTFDMALPKPSSKKP